MLRVLSKCQKTRIPIVVVVSSELGTFGREKMASYPHQKSLEMCQFTRISMADLNKAFKKIKNEAIAVQNSFHCQTGQKSNEQLSERLRLSA